MVNFDEMVIHEDMKDVILFLIGRREQGMSHPSLDRFFNLHKADKKYESYNTKLISDTKILISQGAIVSGYKKGPNWKAPKFVTEKKYGIE